MNEKANKSSVPKTSRSDSHPQSTQILVHEHAFLSGMTEHQLRIISDCSRPIHFAAGEVIFREGDPADRFFLIQRGRVALESNVKGAGLSFIQTIGPGEVLGWSWLFPPFFWHFDARAMETTDAFFISGKVLREECESDHDLGYELLKRVAAVLVQRLQATRRRLLELPGMPD
ncbi:MAG: Crp/Fnr family transcriptional regulator [Pedosphaera sp.]|nr:Crp/Fnr family transcriptional regulator [Pedosphaera sp.]